MGSYGMNGLPGMYGQPGMSPLNAMFGQPGMGSMNGNAGANPKGKKDAAKFQPSKPLRDLITDRLLEQHTLLRKAELRIDNLVGISNKGRSAGKDRTGDQHIAADSVEEIIAKGAFSTSQPGYGFGKPGMELGGAGTLARARGSRGSRLRRREHSIYNLHDWENEGPWMSPYAPLDQGMLSQALQMTDQQILRQMTRTPEDSKKIQKKMEKVDPMLRYKILEDEIQALLAHAGSGPFELNSPIAMDVALKHVLGAGKGDLSTAMLKVATVDSSDSEEDGEDVSGNPGATSQSPPQPMNFRQPNQYQGQQPYPPQFPPNGQQYPYDDNN